MKFRKILMPLLLSGCILMAAPLRAQETEPASASALAAVAVPKGAVRMIEVPDTIVQTLAGLIKAGGDTITQGDSEVLAWTGPTYKKSLAPSLMAKVQEEMKTSGWAVENSESKEDLYVISAIKSAPKKRALIGMWVVADEALLLSWTEMLPVVGAAQAPAQAGTQPAKSNAVAQTAGASSTKITLDLDASAYTVNVMKAAMPPIPSFQNLPVKAGYIRGYVKDSKGKPLAGAKLGVRSTAVGGAYSGASGKTDANGYYEIQIPFGVGHFYCAGYAVDYGEGRAGLGLHPADGEIDQFASNVGGVENFVLLPYGIADRDDVQDNPRYLNNYYGGSVIFSWSVADERPIFASPTDLPANAQMEITFTPTSAMIDGSPGRGIVIRKRIGTGFGQLYVNNLPIANYQMTAKLIGGGSLKMKEVGPNGGSAFGIEPKAGASSVSLLLRPSSAKPESAVAGHGNWDQISVSLTR